MKIQISPIIAVAVPVIAAVIGGAATYATTIASVNKDYVQMAVDVIAKRDTDPNLRQWSVKVVNKLGPVPITDPARTASLVLVHRINLPANLATPCEDLSMLKGKTGADVFKQMLDDTEKYGNCRLKHAALVNIIAQVNKAADAQQAALRKYHSSH
jgi:hypothetical protein